MLKLGMAPTPGRLVGSGRPPLPRGTLGTGTNGGGVPLGRGTLSGGSGDNGGRPVGIGSPPLPRGTLSGGSGVKGGRSPPLPLGRGGIGSPVGPRLGTGGMMPDPGGRPEMVGKVVGNGTVIEGTVRGGRVIGGTLIGGMLRVVAFWRLSRAGM